MQHSSHLLCLCYTSFGSKVKVLCRIIENCYRQFVQKAVLLEDVEKVVSLAMKASSVCNWQSCKVYFYQDEGTNIKLGELVAGNTEFKKDVPQYLVVTSTALF